MVDQPVFALRGCTTGAETLKQCGRIGNWVRGDVGGWLRFGVVRGGGSGV
jgi:hypothetical protein